MEIKDLRIGNLIRPFNSNTFCIIKGIDSDNINVDYLNGERINLKISRKYFTGIPLTEELLLKMGFEDFDVIYSKSPDLVISKDLEWVGIYNIHLEYDIHYDCPKYIHQLQNLYHALTGQELTLP